MIIRQCLRRFLEEESAQATTEYLLMLSVMVALALVVMKRFIKPVYERLARELSNRLQQGAFPAGEGMRRNPLIRGQ